MTYIRSALLISEQESLDFGEVIIPDAFVFDLNAGVLNDFEAAFEENNGAIEQ